MSTLIRDKVESELVDARKSSSYSEKDKCALMEGLVDSVHAVGMVMNGSQYESSPDVLALEGLETDLWSVLEDKYGVISSHQIFADAMELHFESRFEGTFTNGDGDRDHSRVDYTQHCICALMKVESLLFRDTLGATSYYSYHIITTLSGYITFRHLYFCTVFAL